MADLRLANCDCYHQSPNAPAGYVDEVQCWDCNDRLTAQDVRGFDDKELDTATHPLCGKCFDRWTVDDRESKELAQTGYGSIWGDG